MILWTLAASATLIAADVAPHRTEVTHREAVYEVVYQPHVRTSAKTIGMAAGTRPSTERCHWTSEVAVERTIRRSGRDEGHGKMLPATRLFEGGAPGSCRQVKRTVEQAQARSEGRIRHHLAAVAASDRPMLLADIDAAHALASAD